jgi:hypothetical protein
MTEPEYSAHWYSCAVTEAMYRARQAKHHGLYYVMEWHVARARRLNKTLRNIIHTGEV